METKQKRIVIIVVAVVVVIILIVGAVLIVKNKTSSLSNKLLDPVPVIGDRNGNVPPELITINEMMITGTIEKIDLQSFQIKVNEEVVSIENIPKNLFYPVILKVADLKVPNKQALLLNIKDEKDLKLGIEKMEDAFPGGTLIVQPEKSQKFNITDNTFVVSIVNKDISNIPISDLKVGMKIYMNYEKETSNALTINIQ